MTGAAAKLIARLGEAKLDAFFVSAPANVRYLTGFTGSNGLVVVARSGLTLFTDPRYTIQAGEQSSCPVRVARGPLSRAAAKLAARKRWRRVGFESGRMIFSDYSTLRDSLGRAVTLSPLGPLVEELRMVKSPDEISRIRRSVLTNSLALDAALPVVRAGVTERDIAAELEYQQRRHGAEKAAFDTIVAAGPRSALPHAEPGPQPIIANHLLLIDMGTCQDGYSSDMTRVFALGRAPAKLRTIYRAVLEAQQAATAAVRPGVTAAYVDGQARKVLKAHGLGPAFVHSTGHGLGLEIHEAPRIGAKDTTVLAAGMVITIEPGAYIEGLGGVRIEDTVLVTPSGHETLTPTSKELISL